MPAKSEKRKLESLDPARVQAEASKVNADHGATRKWAADKLRDLNAKDGSIAVATENLRMIMAMKAMCPDGRLTPGVFKRMTSSTTSGIKLRCKVRLLPKNELPKVPVPLHKHLLPPRSVEVPAGLVWILTQCGSSRVLL